MRRRFIVFGEARSGTTILTTLLGAQPGARAQPALVGGALRMVKRWGRGVTSALSPAERVAVAGALNEALARGGREPLEPDACSTLAAAVEAALDALDDDAWLVGTKCHGPDALIEPLLDHADLHVLYLARDPRDVIRSRARRGETHLARKLVGWRRSIAIARRIHHRRFLFVRYEDLVRDLRGTFARVGLAFGWPLDPAAAEAWRRPAGQRPNTSFDDDLTRLDPAPAERWRGAPDDPWVQHAQVTCAHEIARLGYAPGPPVPPSVRAAAHLRDRWATLRRTAGDATRSLQARRRPRELGDASEVHTT